MPTGPAANPHLIYQLLSPCRGGPGPPFCYEYFALLNDALAFANVFALQLEILILFLMSSLPPTPSPIAFDSKYSALSMSLCPRSNMVH